MRGIRASGGQQGRTGPSEVIEFIPKPELDRAQREIDTQQQEIHRLEQENERLQQGNERLQREIHRLQEKNERLRQELEAALRAAKRQAAPHSRGVLAQHPKTPGRKPGRKYGRQACRPVPPRVDETIPVPLPEHCPQCGGGVEFQRRESQYQEEIVRRTRVRRFEIEVGCCRGCGCRVQGRHAWQTSDAVGVGAVQIGPEALALAAILNQQMGLSLGHTRQALAYGFGLSISRSGLCRALARLGRRAAPVYDGLVAATRQALVNVPDETGWKVGGRLCWMHVAVSEQVTVYAILPGRGFEQSATILGADYVGFLVHDGLRSYYRYAAAFHQSCLNHLIVRCKEMARLASPAAARFPLQVKDRLQTALQVRDRYLKGAISEHGLRTATGRLEAQLDRLLDKVYRNPANRRLARHLAHEQPWLFSFLHCPGLDATNHEAERAIRWMVIARKVWGGNRTWAGALTQQRLVSVLRTCWQQDKDPFERLVALLRAPEPQMLDLVPGDDRAGPV